MKFLNFSTKLLSVISLSILVSQVSRPLLVNFICTEYLISLPMNQTKLNSVNNYMT